MRSGPPARREPFARPESFARRETDEARRGLGGRVEVMPGRKRFAEQGSRPLGMTFLERKHAQVDQIGKAVVGVGPERHAFVEERSRLAIVAPISGDLAEAAETVRYRLGRCADPSPDD